MSRIKLYCNNSGIVDSNSPDTRKVGQGNYDIHQEYGQRKILFLGFEVPRLSTIRRRSISFQQFACCIGASAFPEGTTVGTLKGSLVTENVNFDALTYNNMPALASNDKFYYSLTTTSWRQWQYASTYTFSKAELVSFFQNSPCIGIPGIRNVDYPDRAIFFEISEVTTAIPYFEISVSDSLIPYIVQGINKRSGSIDPSIDQKFEWQYYTTSTANFIDAVQASSTFYWQSIYDDVTNSISVPGQTNEVTIPANTFPTTGIKWWVSVTDQDGNVDTSPTYTLNTGDRETIATPTAPKDNVRKDEKQDIVFSWSTSNALGNNPTSSDLQYKVNDGEWQSLASIAGGNKSYTAPANTLPNAVILWRVRSTNLDGVVGHWSEPAQFTTYDQLITANAVSPSTAYIPSDEDNVFAWNTDSFQGTWVTGADLQYKIGDGEWQTLATLRNSDATQTTIQANTLPVVDQPQYWRVRVYNGDDVAGPWSSAQMFRTVDLPIIVSNLAPKNGSARDETVEIVFSWNTASSLSSQPTGADLQWRLPQGDWQTLGSVEGAVKSFTAPANTFPGSVIYWRVRAYNQDGAAGNWSSEAYFTTVDAPSVASPIAPIGTIEDTDDDLLFRWSTRSSSGTPPTRADLQYSYDGSAWIDLGQTDGTQYLNVTGGTIHAGTVQWRVRSYNRNGTAGEWSNPVAFVAHAAPRILDITADSKPFTTITWQATDQQTYEIVIDNQVTYGSFFGEEKSFQLPDYLEDGTHTVKIRVQNAMSMWSKWGELSFSVLNDPGEEIHLTGDFDVDAELYWADESDYADYLVYRDGILIAETSNRFFSDRVVLGEHAYYVVNRFGDGYYSKSNEVECTLNTDTPLVAFLSGGEWMPLEKSENPKQSQRFTRTRVVAYHHFSGDKNPTPEVGDEEDLVAEYDAAWFYTEEGSKKLRSMVGQALIIKSRGEEVVIGVLEGYSKVNRKHFRGFSFNLKQMEWKDYICVE